MDYRLTPVQEKYLFEIKRMMVSHTTKENSHYHIAKELEKMGLLKLIESGSPLIRTILTNAGKDCIKKYEHKK